MNTPQSKQYKITIFGQEYTLKSDDSIEVISSIGQVVDTYMHDIATKTGSKDTSLIAVLTAIKLAHELHFLQYESHNQRHKENALINKIDQTLHMLDSF